MLEAWSISRNGAEKVAMNSLKNTSIADRLSAAAEAKKALLERAARARADADSPEAAERFRQMSVADRLRLTLQMIDEAIPHLTRGTPEQVRRRFELLRQENDERNQHGRNDHCLGSI